MKEKGLLALFTDPDQLVEAAKRLRALQYSKMDAFTPFPIHGLEKILGLKKSILPWITLMCAIGGGLGGFGLQAFTSAIDWPINVGGKPMLSWPAFVPITFETTVLIGGVLSVLAFFALCGLPRFDKPVLDERITNDHFGLFIEEDDPQFNAQKLNEVLKECNAKEIKTI